MTDNFTDIHNFLLQNTIEIVNKKLSQVVKSFNFINFSEKEDNTKTIFENIEKSKVVVINQFEDKIGETDDSYYIVIFEKTIMKINKSSLSFLNQLFSTKPDLNIVFLSDIKSYLTITTFNEIKVDSIFTEEISNFIQQFYSKKTGEISAKHIKLWNCIQFTIVSYLIQQSYQKINLNRIDCFIPKQYQNNSHININENDYFTLRIVGIGSIFLAELIYFIERGELFVIKKPNTFDSQIPKLIQRQMMNYSQLEHPFFARFIGKVNGKEFFVAEYIDGRMLPSIKNDSHFEENNKFTIIFELMLAIEFVHHNKLIYRDLKPDNVMIDKSNTIVLIDFDRMISENRNTKEFTSDFQSNFAAPEINSGRISSKCDIYSLGQMMKYIINIDKYPVMQQMFEKCITENENQRPTVLELIVEFYINFYSQINIHHFLENNEQYFLEVFDSDVFETLKTIEKNKLNPVALNGIGEIYENGKYVQKDIEKAIHFYSLSAEQNNSKAQYKLGSFYFKGEYIKQDYKKAYHYLSLSASQNDKDGQFGLGYMYICGNFVHKDIKKAFDYFIKAADQGHAKAQHNVGVYYYDGQYTNIDIDKAIHYFTLAAEKNLSESQYNLGEIYSTKNYSRLDVNKAIKYFLLASNQNHINAQYKLGLIYGEGTLIERNINKAIHFLTLAANNNNAYAQMTLGLIYNKGNYVNIDQEKAVYYFKLAADQNYSEAQFFLGLFYSHNEYNQLDINQAIHYYKLAADQDNEDAQNNLGNIYLEGKLVPRDMDKAIYYLSLAARGKNPDIQYMLGTIYYNGFYTSININKALYYYQLSASHNYAPALYILGVFYSEGKIVPQNITKAIDYYSLAAKLNNFDSYVELGIIYSEGKYVKRDIDKAIHYFTIASKQNNVRAYMNLGILYFEGNFVPIDIPKAIYYFQILANQNIPQAQYNLAVIYSNKKYNHFDIVKAIDYYKLASESNLSIANFNLAVIYYEGTLVSRNISKALHYLKLAADQRLIQAQLLLAKIYFYGKFVKCDIDKAIYYFHLAANQNDPNSQCILGVFYYDGYYVSKNLNKSLFYLTQSSLNGCINSHFSLGYIYHDKKFIGHDIHKAIHHYKEASSFNNQFAKNNLGVIYKNGFGNEIEKNLTKAIEYFKEAINQSNDLLATYNLASIYIFDESLKNNFDESFNLLVMSSERDFLYSKILLCLALLIKFDFDVVNKKIEIMMKIKMSDSLFISICNLIKQHQLEELIIFNEYWAFFRNHDFLYNYFNKIIPSKDLFKIKTNEDKKVDINSEFYKGFGII